MKRKHIIRILFLLLCGFSVTWCEAHFHYPELLYKDSYIYNRLADEELLIEDFRSSVLLDEETRRHDSTIIIKWNRSVLFRLFDEPTDKQKQIVLTTATLMERLTGFSVSEVKPDEEENAILHFRFADRDQLWRIQVEYGKSEADAKATFERAVCTSITTYDKALGYIRFAENYIATDLDEEELTSCMIEEFGHVFGLGHETRYRPSIFGKIGEPQQLSINDMILVRTLYDERLKAGMSHDQAMPIVKIIIPELVKSVRKHGEIALYQ